MTTTTEMRDFALKHAKLVLIGNPGAELMPIWDLVDRTGEHHIFATPFFGEESKDAVAAFVKQKMREIGAVGYSHVSEAWAAFTTPDEWRDDKRPASKRDNRIEVVMIMAAARGSETAMTSYEIVRGPDAVVTELKLVDQGEGGTISGRFANLLEDAT